MSAGAKLHETKAVRRARASLAHSTAFEEGAPCSIFSISSWASGSWPCSASTPPRCGSSDMAEILIWGVGALVIGGYMVAALLRPEKF